MENLRLIASILFVFLLFIMAFLLPVVPLEAKPFFEDGLLGLTKSEVHLKLGSPHAIRSRKAALRVFSYYSLRDWKKYFSKLVSPENGEDVYTYKRNGVQVRYSFVYTIDYGQAKDFPTLYVKRVEIEFSPASTLRALPHLIREFKPPKNPDANVFRSNLWILIFKGPPSADATLVIKDWNKEDWDWSLAYQMFSVNGIPDYLTLDSYIDRLEFTVQSLPKLEKRTHHTHEPFLNPYSKEFLQRPPKPQKPKKTIPIPSYAD